MAMGKAKMAKKKMRGGGMAKKKMMRGGMAKKKMMSGGMYKKKMMRGGRVWFGPGGGFDELENRCRGMANVAQSSLGLKLSDPTA